MEQAYGKRVMTRPGKNPVDDAVILYSSDIAVPQAGAELYLAGFRSDTVSRERINPLEFISLGPVPGRDKEDRIFHSFREADAFLREVAKDAPSVKDGAYKLGLYVEWENKNEAAFKGFTAFYGNLYVTKEMEHASSIVARAVTVRDMFDAGFLRPAGFTDKQWEDKCGAVSRSPVDKEYLVSSLRHLEGVNGQFRELVRFSENARRDQVSLKPSRPRGQVGKGQQVENNGRG